jgi:hypothetical protein
MSFRSKPIGWRYESARHSLAAKGIRTRYDSVKVEKGSVGRRLREVGRELSGVRKELQKKEETIFYLGDSPYVEEGDEEKMAQLEKDVAALKYREDELKREWDAERAKVPEHLRGKHRYMAEGDKYDKIAGVLQNLASDGRAEVPDFHGEHKEYVMKELFDRYRTEFGGGEAEGKFRANATKSFLDDDLTNEMKDYKDGKIDEQTLRSNLERRAGKHREQYSATLDVFNHLEKNSGGGSGSLMPDALRGKKTGGFFAMKDEEYMRLTKKSLLKQPKFGSVAWQEMMMKSVEHKVMTGDDLTPQEKVFLEVQFGYNKRMER